MDFLWLILEYPAKFLLKINIFKHSEIKKEIFDDLALGSVDKVQIRKRCRLTLHLKTS